LNRFDDRSLWPRPSVVLDRAGKRGKTMMKSPTTAEPGPMPITLSHHALRGETSRLHSIWLFEAEDWQLLDRCGQVGCHCGSPPSHPGAYHGQVVRKECPTL
jgi:hypothetical protein